MYNFYIFGHNLNTSLLYYSYSFNKYFSYSIKKTGIGTCLFYILFINFSLNTSLFLENVLFFCFFMIIVHNIIDIIIFIGLPVSVGSKRFFIKNQKEKVSILELLTIFKENDENYGYRRITDELHHRGHQVNHKKVYRLMKKLGISCIKFSHKTRKYRSYKGKIGTIAKNRINRRFHTPYPYQKLTTDVTEFKT